MPALSVRKEIHSVPLTRLSRPGGQSSRYPRGGGPRSWDSQVPAPLWASDSPATEGMRGFHHMIPEAPGFFCPPEPSPEPSLIQALCWKALRGGGTGARGSPLFLSLPLASLLLPVGWTPPCIHPPPHRRCGRPQPLHPPAGGGGIATLSCSPPPWKPRQGNYFWNKSGYTTNELFISGHGGEEAFCWAS